MNDLDTLEIHADDVYREALRIVADDPQLPPEQVAALIDRNLGYARPRAAVLAAIAQARIDRDAPLIHRRRRRWKGLTMAVLLVPITVLGAFDTLGLVADLDASGTRRRYLGTTLLVVAPGTLALDGFLMLLTGRPSLASRFPDWISRTWRRAFGG